MSNNNNTITLDDDAPKLDAATKQLTVTTPNNASPICFALTDAQFTRALAVFAPPPRTKPNLWRDDKYIEELIDVCAYLESVQYMRPNGSCFAQTLVSNHFDHCMKEEFGETIERFSIDEWFNDSRGEIPAALRKWDPKGHEPMPMLDMQVDWYGALTDTDLAYPGFVKLFAKCIKLEEKTEECINRRKHGAMTTFGAHPGERTPMPAPINQQANFDRFTPSGLLSGGGGLKFKGSGLL